MCKCVLTYFFLFLRELSVFFFVLERAVRCPCVFAKSLSDRSSEKTAGTTKDTTTMDSAQLGALLAELLLPDTTRVRL